jgi:hypothetical protein
MSGWIKLHRDILDHWIWKNNFYFKAWIAIIMNVNHEDKKILIEGELIECKRGQSLLSLSSWVDCFGRGWTMQKVRTFFSLLKNDSMINTEGLRKTTRLTVCNYDTYQGDQQANNKEITSKQQGDNKEITTNKNDKEGIKNEKNEKNKYSDFVLMTKNEYEKLINEHGELNTKTFIEILNNYKGSTGKKYKSDYMTILNWVIDKAKKENKYVSQSKLKPRLAV